MNKKLSQTGKYKVFSPLILTEPPSKLRNWRRRWFPFRKRSMPFLTVDAIIGNQAFQNERCHICFSLGLDKVETGIICWWSKMHSYLHWCEWHRTFTKGKCAAPPKKIVVFQNTESRFSRTKTVGIDVTIIGVAQQWKSKFSLPWEILTELRCEFAAVNQMPIRDFSWTK